ncbi:MAG: TonB-dependent receptor [Acidobacteriota bacterium]|nr:TonB-dependent receptor [Acidobacteriota bacterium]
MKLQTKFLIAALFVIGLPIFALAQNGGTIRGTITSETSPNPLHDVSVEIIQLRRSVETDENGVYEFTNVPPGTYTILTHIEGFSDRTETVRINAGETRTLDFRLSLTSLREEVTVTASGTEESVFQSFQSVNSVGSTQLRQEARTSIGEVLEREPGVGKRSFGPGSSRPVIRGFDGDRVLVTQDGVRTGSLGSQSGDHGEPVDPLNLERLEVVKGPATLLYGSNAIGGVVNAVTTDEDEPHEGARGFFTGLGATNNKQAGVSGGVEYGYRRFLFDFNGGLQREGDYRTPIGRVPNSASRSYNFKGGLGFFGEKGFLRGNYSRDKRRYGIPYAALFEAHHEEEEEESASIFAETLPEAPDEEIDIRMRTNNFRIRGGFHDLNAPITRMNFALNFTDYRHQEVETADGIDEIATVFDNDVFSYRATFEQKPFGRLTGRFGFDGYTRSYLTEGAEALVEGKVRQHNFAVFGLEEFNFGRVSLQFGGRVENNRYRPTNPELPNRSFTGFSGAAAARFNVWEGGAFIANFTSAYRAPALEELYNEGPHIGTITFEIGNPLLKRERSNGIELSFRQKLNRFRFNGSFFYYRINDFVFLAPQDEDDDGEIDLEDGLPVAAYLQDDSRFVGADVSLDFDINKYLNAFFVGDIVKAELTNGSIPLPRITPARARLGLDFRYRGLSIRPEGVFVSRKGEDDIFPTETPTAGYGLFNVNGSYTFGSDHYAHIIGFSAFNLNDKLYRNHLSFIKNLMPEIGRGFRASYTFRFF